MRPALAENLLPIETHRSAYNTVPEENRDGSCFKEIAHFRCSIMDCPSYAGG